MLVEKSLRNSALCLRTASVHVDGAVPPPPPHKNMNNVTIKMVRIMNSPLGA